MPGILGDVRALAYVERWAKKEGVWAKSAFCGQKAKFAGQKKLYNETKPCMKAPLTEGRLTLGTVASSPSIWIDVTDTPH